MQLRDYQTQMVNDIHNAWSRGVPNVLGLLATGGGKTPVVGEVLKYHNGACAAIAHRSELISQMSLTLARFDLSHRIIAPDATVKFIGENNRRETGFSMLDPTSVRGVASIDTLRSRHNKNRLGSWPEQVTLWNQDEAHHVLQSNKWGIVSNHWEPEGDQWVNVKGVFPNARGLGVTATAGRADGKGLGRHHDGMFDEMVIGPPMRELINRGYLTDYRIFVPPSDIDYSALKVGATGDYSTPGMKKAVEKSHIVGDVVDHYLRFAPGKLGVTFATDVETSEMIAAQYNARGVKAHSIDAKTPTAVRAELIRRFRNGDVKQLVNVDLFGEGFDLPALEVVSMARPTQSYGLYAQQFGRALRPFPGKDRGIIIDHVKNVVHHGLPDAHREWTLDRRDKKSSLRDLSIEPQRACLGCFQPYRAFLKACPYCGTVPEPQSRQSVEFVEGDLEELTAEVLAQMRGELSRVDMSAKDVEARMLQQGQSALAARGVANRHQARISTQGGLRDIMGQWGGVRHYNGASDSEIQKEFYWQFGVDVMTAMTYSPADALKLQEKIERELR